MSSTLKHFSSSRCNFTREITKRGFVSPCCGKNRVSTRKKLTPQKHILFRRIQHINNCVINESFPAIEFHDFYIHYSNSSIVLSLSALLLTVYMFVQDSTVHRGSVFSGICAQCVTIGVKYPCVVIPDHLSHNRRSLVVKEVQNLLFASEDMLGDRKPKLRNLGETFERMQKVANYRR